MTSVDEAYHRGYAEGYMAAIDEAEARKAMDPAEYTQWVIARFEAKHAGQ